MKNKNVLITIIICVVITLVLVYLSVQASVTQANASVLKTDSVAVKQVSSQIVADGTVTAANTATLHFQTGGKLLYLPFKEGDTIQQGQTIAQLDSYQLQQEMIQAANTYRSSQDNFNQTQEINNTGSLAQQQSAALKNAGGALSGDQNYNVANDAAKRIVDENQATLDNAAINVKLANYAISLSTLTAPFSGIITHEDVTVANQNITPTTGFTIIDPNSLVFRAQINENDIDFVKVGADATVQLNGLNQVLTGTVTKVYPNKQTLPNGESVYQVDVTTPTLATAGKLDQAGVVKITSSTDSSVMLVPAWTVLSHQSIWVIENGEQVLKHITVGKTHGDMIEVTSGLSSQDDVIVNPGAIAAKHYTML